jgi:putative ABC transport system substrate-binding protein
MTDHRRMLALVTSAIAAPLIAGAENRATTPRIGILSLLDAPSGPGQDPRFEAFQQGLQKLGYVPGQDIQIEFCYASGRVDLLAAQAADLVQQKVDVILAFAQPPREAARKATSTIPIVTVSGSDPVREGWAQSLARPGGNVTGLTVVHPELVSKCLELLKVAIPKVDRVAVLINPVDVVDATEVVREMEASAGRLGLQLQILDVRGPDDFEAAIALAQQRHAQGLFALAAVGHGPRLAALARAIDCCQLASSP